MRKKNNGKHKNKLKSIPNFSFFLFELDLTNFGIILKFKILSRQSSITATQTVKISLISRLV